MSGAAGHRAVRPWSQPEHNNHVSEMQQKRTGPAGRATRVRLRGRRMPADSYFTSSIFRVSLKLPACTR